MRAIFSVFPLYVGTAATGVVALISVPVMVNSASLAQWAVVGIGQTVGSVLAPIASVGWAVTGPAAIARASNGERRELFLQSSTARLLVAPLTIIGGALLGAGIAHSADLLLMTAAVASTALVAVDSSFYFLGTGQLWRLFLFTVAPRVLGSIGGLLLLTVADADLIAVPLGTAIGTGLGIALSSYSLLRGGNRWLASREELGSSLRTQVAAVVSGISGGIFVLIPTAAVRVFAPSELDAFVLYDRLFRQMLTFIGPGYNFLQGWVPRARAHALERRLRASGMITAIIAVASVLVFLVLGDYIVRYFSAGELSADALFAASLGLVVAGSVGEMYMSKISLVVRGRMAQLARISVIATVIGTGLIALGAFAWGSLGVLLAISATMVLRTYMGWLAGRQGRG